MSKPCATCKSLISKEKFGNRYVYDCGNSYFGCAKIKNYLRNQHSKRMFKHGDKVTDINQILQKDWFLVLRKTWHKKALLNVQTNTLLTWIKKGYVFFAERKQDGKTK